MKSKIMWAVDPSQNPTISKNIVKELKTWAKYLNCDIQPVSMVSRPIFGLPMELTPPLKETLEEMARKSVNKYLRAAHATGFLPPELIATSTISNRKMATEIAQHAEQKNAVLIFANTRAKKTWNPFRLGGFAETLVATSRVPVVLLNPSARATSQVPTVLFPTDFGRESRNALVWLEPWAKAFGSKVLLYNQVESFDFYPSELYGAWQTPNSNFETILNDQKKARAEKALDWSNFLKKKDIECTPIIQSQRKYLVDDIVAIAKKKKVSLIAIASRSGPISQVILGSVARDVLLQSECPVLIFHRPKGQHRPAAVERKTKRHPSKTEKMEPQIETTKNPASKIEPTKIEPFA